MLKLEFVLGGGLFVRWLLPLIGGVGATARLDSPLSGGVWKLLIRSTLVASMLFLLSLLLLVCREKISRLRGELCSARDWDSPASTRATESAGVILLLVSEFIKLRSRGLLAAEGNCALIPAGLCAGAVC